MKRGASGTLEGRRNEGIIPFAFIMCIRSLLLLGDHPKSMNIAEMQWMAASGAMDALEFTEDFN